MDPNCFACPGINRECVNQRRYIHYGDEEYCLNKATANQDEARLRIGDFNSIKLRDMFSQYLFDRGDKEKALKILT